MSIHAEWYVDSSGRTLLFEENIDMVDCNRRICQADLANTEADDKL